MDTQTTTVTTTSAADPLVVTYVPDQSEVKPSWLWVKDARGYGSVTVTLVWVSFIIVSVAYLLSIVDHIGSVSIRPFDTAACSAFFIPILTLYGARKYTDANAKNVTLPTSNVGK
jgi:hypothetical protein